jgi:hypothetical protein
MPDWYEATSCKSQNLQDEQGIRILRWRHSPSGITVHRYLGHAVPRTLISDYGDTARKIEPFLRTT